MKIVCDHCGKRFTITADQLGGRGRCPHCRGEIVLPNAADAVREAPQRGHWLENSASGLASVVIHMAIVLLLAMIPYGYDGVAGEGEEVLIGNLPYEELTDTQEQPLEAESEPSPSETPDALEELVEVEPPTTAADDSSFESDVLASTTAAPSGEAGAFDVGAPGGGSMASGSWEGMLKSLRRHGLDIVIAFDSTGSMSGEINQVKSQIRRIGATLMELVPKARISICTYRDKGDAYVVRGLPLTGDIYQVEKYLDDVSAGGGGDTPESVHEGLRWSMTNNRFRPRARKVILLFGDAPPHEGDRAECLDLASHFRSSQAGVVSTVTCRKSSRLSEFVEIAEAGGGEAFLTADEREIMTQLMVLVFGSRHRGKVLEAFELLER